MREFINKIIKINNLIGLIFIVFNFIYVGFNFCINKGNLYLNLTLLIMTFIYLLLYIYTVYIEENKKVKKRVGKIYKHGKKFIGFINACIILVSVFTNEVNSVFSIIISIITIGLYFVYLAVEFFLFRIKQRIGIIKRTLRRNG